MFVWSKAALLSYCLIDLSAKLKLFYCASTVLMYHIFRLHKEFGEEFGVPKELLLLLCDGFMYRSQCVVLLVLGC